MEKNTCGFQPAEVKISWPEVTDQGLVIATLGTTGHLHGKFSPDSGTFYITDIFVSPNDRQRGVGKALLRAVHAAFLSEGGRRMVADITTRPCGDLMRSVLGEEAVQTVVEGDYLPDEPEYVPPAVGRLEYVVDGAPPPTPPAVVPFTGTTSLL